MTLLELLGIEEERDACAIIACVKRDGRASHGNVKRTLEALTKMGHRTGEIAGEGDGAGIQTDIPREIWLQHLESRGLIGSTVNHPYFTVSHLLLPAAERANHADIKRRAVEIFETRGMEIVLEQDAQVRREALLALGRASEPLYWQLAAIPRGARRMGNRETFHIHLALERELPVHVASLSHTSAVYKIRGDAEALRRYFPELSRPEFKSAITLGHGRYSTNTNSAAEKAQMFSTLGHNGEINSIDRLTREAVALGFQLPTGASDSQILDRVFECLMFNYGLSLIETVEIIFPPVWSESEKYDTPLKPFHRYFRRAFGSLAQGPAAIIAREADEVVFSCDALGLRPLWFGKTEKEYFASSEKGVVQLEAMAENPRPLAPGEKMGLLVRRDREVEVFEHHQMQRRIHEMSSERYDFHRLNEATMTSGLFSFNFAAEEEKAEAQASLVNAENESPEDALAVEERQKERAIKIERTLAATDALAAMGWTKEEVDNLMTMVTGKDPLSGLGYDGPLAAFSKVRRNLSDYFHERVAVVTNPAIDRVREGDHFSVRVFLGSRPSMQPGGSMTQQIELRSPILLGGTASPDSKFAAAYRSVAEEFGTLLIDDLEREFSESLQVETNPFSAGAVLRRTLRNAQIGSREELPTSLVARTIEIVYDENQTLGDALQRITQEARDAVAAGVSLLILDDARGYAEHQLFVDAHLALAAVDQALNTQIDISVSGCAVTSDIVSGFGTRDPSPVESGSLRRKCSILLKSGQIRNLHDVCFSLGCGADAVNPYAMFEVALRDAADEEQAKNALRNCFIMQHTGIEKVMSTMGVHEVDGYGRLFASIGLSNEIANIFGIKNYCGSDRVGLTLERLDRELRDRLSSRREQARKGATKLNGTSGLMREYRRQPYVWSAAGKVARKEERYDNFLHKLAEIEQSAPVSLRHLLDLQERSIVTRNLADTKIGNHSAPIFIAAMSFGSQGETTFRAYAEAAKRLKIVAMNGEGGEIPDMMGRYKEYRGQQVASGRFGVNIHLLNSADFIEIKIGQGAKPGEGGHLPGMKVTELIAKTRHTPQGIDLLSPSNNHDIYSIEDLAQVIAELKTANPHAKVSVKIPAVPFIGPIATGIAKARADIIAISGYDGGTGAARKHSLRHVGMPVEIGVKEAHRALLKAGLRDRVEVWADGGIKSGADVIKLMLLGANRVGFGTMAMAAVGCTSCRECNQGTCHVGITAHHQSVEKAKEAGLKKYTPRDYDKAVDALVTFFKEVINEVGIWTMRLGFHRTQELVGRSDLMRQTRGLDQIDLEYLLKGIEFA